MNKDLIAIFDYMEREKGISRDVVVKAIEEALQAAAQKSVQGSSNVSVQINSKTGNIDVFCEKEIVEEVEDTAREISLEDAQVLDPDCEVGQFIDVLVTPKDFGRIAAKKARDIISQKLRVAEKNVIYDEYRHRLNELVSGSVKGFFKGANVIIDLGKVEALMPKHEYPKTEKYAIGDRVLALLYEVQETEGGGARVIMSRSCPEFVRQLFAQEVPEVADNIITLEKIVREPGYRTKITVSSSDAKIDPVGSCVGVGGNRIKNVIRELNHEKIDIVAHIDDPLLLLEEIMKPVSIQKLLVEEDGDEVIVVVDDQDYPTAIGKKGMNARLNGALINRNLTVKRMTEFNREVALKRLELLNSNDPVLDKPVQGFESINPLVLRGIREAEIETVRQLLECPPDKLSEIPGALEAMDTIMDEIM